MRHSVRALATAALLMFAVPTANAQTWNFDDIPLGSVTPFSQTKSDVTANFFTADGPANSFSISPNFFTLLSGNVLFSANGLGASLGIGFDTALDSLDFRFAMNTQSPATPLTVEAFLGLTPVGTFLATGLLQPSGFVEGDFVTQGSIFDNIVISSAASDFAIDLLSVGIAQTVPEPAMWPLLAVGMVLLGGLSRRRRGIG